MLDDELFREFRMVHAPVFHFKENVFAGLVGSGRVAVAELPADHMFNQRIFADLRCVFKVCHGPAVTQDRDGVCNVTDLVEFMGNNDTGDALLLKGLQQIQKITAVALVERRRGLVQDEDLTVFAQGLGDLDELLLADADLVDGRIGIVRQADALHQRRRLDPGLDPVDRTVLHLGISDKNIFRNAQHRDQRQLLVDNGDTGMLRLLDAFEAADLAVHDKIAGIGPFRVDAGKHVHQRGFSRAVFTDQRLDLAAPDLKADIVQRLDTRKFLGDVPHFEDIILHLSGSFSQNRTVFPFGRSLRPGPQASP